MKVVILLLLIPLVACSPSTPNPVTTFERLQTKEAIELWGETLLRTDECSSTYGLHWFAETFLNKNWEDCCIQHDFDYRFGSIFGITKDQADYELWQCVDSSGHPVVANIIYDAVYLFGGLYYEK